MITDPEKYRTYQRNYKRVAKYGIDGWPLKRKCLHCGRGFEMSTKFRELCSDACKVARFKKRSSDRVLNYRKRHPLRVRKLRREEALRYKYGSSTKEKHLLYKNQHGRCANIGCQIKFKSVESAHFDHCHETGRNRALLCAHCNLTLGLCHERKEVLKGLVAYLVKHR